MNTSELVEWQRVDPENGLVEPWLTWPCMEKIKTFDLSDKVILETGGGRSSSWWRKKAKWVDTIESSLEWADQIKHDCGVNGLDNGRLFADNIADGTTEGVGKYFSLIPVDRLQDYDIFVIDGIFRVECIEMALRMRRSSGFNLKMLIIDNLDQDYVWISPKAMELLDGIPCETFYQPGHINHEGKPWNSRIYYL